MAKSEERVRLITPEFRASFPALVEARRVNPTNLTEKAKFSVQMIFRVTETPESKARGEKVVGQDPAFLAVRAEVQRILLSKLGPDWANRIKERKSDQSMRYRLPFRDGNAAEKKDLEGYGPGTIFCSAGSTYKPGLVGPDKKELLNPVAEFYGGCYARAEIHAYWYSVNGNEGVTFGLDNVQKIRDGEPFSGRKKAEDVFEAIAVPAGAPASGGAAPSTSSDPLMG